ncbi:hypothetical protein AOLI_G00252110 [Acnodon oligacanthus]
MSARTKALLSASVTGLTRRQAAPICSTFSPAEKRCTGRARKPCSVTVERKRRNTWPRSTPTQRSREKRRRERVESKFNRENKHQRNVCGSGDDKTLGRLSLLTAAQSEQCVEQVRRSVAQFLFQALTWMSEENINKHGLPHTETNLEPLSVILTCGERRRACCKWRLNLVVRDTLRYSSLAATAVWKRLPRSSQQKICKLLFWRQQQGADQDPLRCSLLPQKHSTHAPSSRIPQQALKNANSTRTHPPDPALTCPHHHGDNGNLQVMSIIAFSYPHT